jgi:RNA polymerase sigma-70 factor (ECF subfamily)
VIPGPEGKQEWLDQLYRLNRDRVFAYIRKKLNSSEDAEDLLSQVFLEAARCADRFDPKKASEVTWLFTIARNLLNRRLRDFYTRRKIVKFEPIGDMDYADEAAEIDDFIRTDELAAALGALDETRRHIIILSFYRGLSPAEIAEKTGLSYVNVCTLKSRALVELRKKMVSREI